jgi:hypothetical protein
MNKHSSSFSWISSRLFLSFLAGLAGWIAGMAVLLVVDLIGWNTTGTSGRDTVDVVHFDALFGLILGTFVLFVWLFLLVPIALAVPQKSRFWRPFIPTLLGIVIGPLIILLYHFYEVRGAEIAYSSPQTEMGDFLAGAIIYGVPASIVGGVTGFVGAFLNKRLPAPVL